MGFFNESFGDVDIEEIIVGIGILKVLTWIYAAVITFTMLFNNGKFYWLINFGALFP